MEVNVLEVRFESARCQQDLRGLAPPNWTRTEHREYSMGETAKAGWDLGMAPPVYRVMNASFEDEIYGLRMGVKDAL